MELDLTWIEEFIARDVARARKTLATMIRAAGVSQQEVDRRLGRRVGYTSNIVTGLVDLKKEHVALILYAIGVHPHFYYTYLYPKERPFGPIKATGDFVRFLGLADFEVDEVLPPAPAPRPPELDWQPLRRLIDEAVQQALAAQEAAKKKRQPRKRKRPAREK